MENDELIQKDEIEALKTIYAEELIVKPNDNNNNSYEIRLSLFDGPSSSSTTTTTTTTTTTSSSSSLLSLSFSFPPTYPSRSPPVFQLNASWLTTLHLPIIEQRLLNIYEERKPEPIIFHWIQFLKDEVLELLGLTQESILGKTKEQEEREEVTNEEEEIETGSIDIMSCTPITDRKSKFQAFVAEVYSLEDVRLVMKQLTSNKKIANATHNMYAYRILKPENGTTKLLENRDDDGEGGGGDKILFVLQSKKVENVMVVVSRWFGGIHLGQARFKHITDCTTEALQKWQKLKSSSTTSGNSSSGGSSTNKLRSSESIYNQIKWDPELDQSKCVIGYEDRFEGMQEIAFDEWPCADIPFHRVWYFKINDKIVWDRKKREDLLKQK